MKIRSICCAVVALAFALFAAASDAATGWVAGRDMRINELSATELANPNGQVPEWSYGRIDPGTGNFSLLTSGEHVNLTGGANNGLQGYGSDLSLFVNTLTTTMVQNFGVGPVLLEPDKIRVHPCSAGQMPTVRWTAPRAGRYLGSFEWTDSDPYGGEGAIGRVLVNGASIFQQAWNNGLGNGASGTFDLVLAAGDHIDFALGMKGDYTYDSTAFDATITEMDPEPVEFAMSPGFNLAGNSTGTQINVAATFGDAAKVTSVWKWVASRQTWAFYSPALADGGAAFAASKGYDFLTTINGGEGFWVNANVQFSVPLPAGAAIPSASFQGMPSGWNLNAVGDSPGPGTFNVAIGLNSPAPGDIPLNLNTLWAWDKAQNNWYFHAPSLEESGGLPGYIQANGFLDFGTRTLDPGMGFWVNKP